MFAKGRSNEESLIENSSEVFNKVLLEIPQYWKTMELSIMNDFREIAKQESNGDIEIEYEIFYSLFDCINDYGELLSCFYEAFFLSIYSFYERMLKKIVSRNCIVVIKDYNHISYAMILINSIKRHLNTVIFEIVIEVMITEIDSKYRLKRNEIAHEGYEGFCQIESVFIEEFLQKIKDVLIYINKMVENRG